MRSKRGQALTSWIFLGAMTVLCSVLGVLQYRWIGEVSRAERDRLHESLQENLARLSRSFQSELASEINGLRIRYPGTDAAGRLAAYGEQFTRWRDSTRNAGLFRRIALAVPEAGEVNLYVGDASSGEYRRAAWPETWLPIRDRLRERSSGGGPGFGGFTQGYADVLEVPIFSRTDGPGGRTAELEWILFQVDLEYAGTNFLPALLRNDLGPNWTREFAVTVTSVTQPGRTLFAWPEQEQAKGPVDGSVMIFSQEGLIRPGPRGRHDGPRRGMMPPHGGPRPPAMEGPRRAPFETGRWKLTVRSREGSLEAVVQKARTRNLLVSAAILVLLMGCVAALVLFTRRAQRLAGLQMEFIAGVSHELRTPLSVMRTAGHNLQTRLASDAARVQRYGKLIEQESERLTAIVEQVLRFANADAGRAIAGRESVAVAALIQEALRTMQPSMQEAGFHPQLDLAADLAPVKGDPVALGQALENLVNNAYKYGRAGEQVRISAANSTAEPGMIEIRVADRGPGIPPEEVKQIFEPFFRGRHAIEDQIHGTGLGLSLTQRIVQAHGGRIDVNSRLGEGTEFTIYLPAVAGIERNEYANTSSGR